MMVCISAIGQEIQIDSLDIWNTSTQEITIPNIYDGEVTSYGYTLSQKDIEFGIVAPTLILLELYMEDIKNDSTLVDYGMPPTFYIKRVPTLSDLYEWQKEYFKEQYKD